MKKYISLLTGAVVGILVGILVKDISKLISVVLITIGIVLLITSLLAICKKYADECPKCGTILYRNARVYREKRDGLIRCPHCGCLVRIE